MCGTGVEQGPRNSRPDSGPAGEKSAEALRIKVEMGEIPWLQIHTYAPAALSYSHASITAGPARGARHNCVEASWSNKVAENRKKTEKKAARI